MSDDLANALHNLSADSRQEASPPAAEQEQDDAFDAELVEAEVDDESGQVLATTPAPAPRPISRTPFRTKPPSSGGLKAVASPVLITVGLLMLIPAVWAVLFLSGSITSDKHDARVMAFVMLACWPIAIALIGGGVWFIFQVKKDKEMGARRGV